MGSGERLMTDGVTPLLPSVSVPLDVASAILGWLSRYYAGLGAAGDPDCVRVMGALNTAITNALPLLAEATAGCGEAPAWVAHYPQQVITVADASRLAGVSRQAVELAMRQGRLPRHRRDSDGRLVTFRPAVIAYAELVTRRER